MVRAGFVGVFCVLAGLYLAGAPAFAETVITHPIKGKFDAPTPGLASAKVFGVALPPLGYIDFCARGEMECQFSGGKSEPLTMSTELWDLLQVTNRQVNKEIKPATDMSLYGVADYWTYPVDKGDCEDYVLLKKRYLSELGIKPESLAITVVLDENREGHAILTVITDKGDYVLDNRRSEILRWDETGYIFLKRQSQSATKEWVSLQKTAPQVMVSTRSRSFLSDMLNLGRKGANK